MPQLRRKEKFTMWGFISSSGFATAVLDFTNELSLLGAGLLGLVALSGGMSVFAAIRHHLSQKAKAQIGTAPAPVDYRKAA